MNTFSILIKQVNHSHDHIIGGSYFENENIYSSPEESNGSLSYLLERVSCITFLACIVET